MAVCWVNKFVKASKTFLLQNVIDNLTLYEIVLLCAFFQLIQIFDRKYMYLPCAGFAR